jgi:hypothetical protein
MKTAWDRQTIPNRPHGMSREDTYNKFVAKALKGRYRKEKIEEEYRIRLLNRVRKHARERDREK